MLTFLILSCPRECRSPLGALCPEARGIVSNYRSGVPAAAAGRLETEQIKKIMMEDDPSERCEALLQTCILATVHTKEQSGSMPPPPALPSPLPTLDDYEELLKLCKKG